MSAQPRIDRERRTISGTTSQRHRSERPMSAQPRIDRERRTISDAPPRIGRGQPAGARVAATGWARAQRRGRWLATAAAIDPRAPAARPAETRDPVLRPLEAPPVPPSPPAADGHRAAPAPPAAGWRLASFAGRLAEISGGRASSALTLAFHLAWEAQRQGEPVAWVGRRQRTFFPPDAAEAGVDLGGLVAVWVAGGIDAARAADLLVRSGGFGLVVLDLGGAATLPIAGLARLAGLAQKHHTAVLCLTEKEPGRPSLGPLVSLRAETDRIAQPGGRFLCRARIVKDKRHGPGREHAESHRGPDGLS
jgi:recombination protein RecA